LVAQALIAFPTIVNLKKSAKRRTTIPMIPRIQTVWGRIVASNNRIGFSVEKCGRLKVSLPQANIAPPLSNIDPAMVMIIKLRTEGIFRGWIHSLSKAVPISVTASTAIGKATHIGKFKGPTSDTINIPPSITNSPCAKLMILVEL
jgi:hypothetical protein